MDYRSNNYFKFPNSEKILCKKRELECELFVLKGKYRNVYEEIKNSDSFFRKKFFDIYNYTCAYCGCNADVIPLDKLEVDHFINKKNPRFFDKVRSVYNLVCSCYDCNRTKAALKIDPQYLDLLNPDLNYIKSVFLRDEQYYIRINDAYKNNTQVVEFYNKLKMISQSKRLDYLFLNVLGLNQKLKETNSKKNLNELVLFLSQKRKVHILKRESIKNT